MNSDLVFFNQCFDKKRLKTVISWYCKNFGEEQALRMVEELKKMGFNNATQAGISIGLSDLKTPALKSFLVSEAEVVMSSTHQKFQGAEITCTEKSQRVIDTWHRASEILRKQIVDYFASTDEFNPVYIMALSGARGNFSQVRQLVGMRGLMADPQGQIISFPIRSNFREGLTLTEYFISCSGARKGLVDTALRTADTGYLTRRLVDVSHQVVVKRVACETNRGIFMKPIYSGKKMLLSLKQRLIGRVLAKDLSSVGKQDQEITPELASKIAVLNKPILVRSPLTCSFNNEVCQLCYGWSPAQGTLVSLGEAVGVIAAQSIGEPGTQLTMRTFHTGGVFSGDLLEEIKSPCDGKILFSEAFQGLLIRTAHGKIAFLTKVPGEMLLCPPDHFKKWKQSQPPTTDKRVSTSKSGSESDLVEPKVVRNKGVLNTNFDSLNQKQKFNSVQAQNDIVKIPTFTGSTSHAEHTRSLSRTPKVIGGPEQSHGQISKEVSNTKLLPISFPALTILFVRHGEDVKKNQILAEFSYFGTETNQPIKSKQTLFADFAGKIITVLGGDKKTFQQLDIIKPDKSGRLGFFFVLSASLGATFEQLRNNTQQIRLHKKQLLHTIAHQGDLVDNNYTKLPQYHSSRISSTAKIIPLGIHQSFMPGMVASSKLDYPLTKSRKDLVLPTTWQNFDKRQQSFCPPVIATTSKSGGEHQRWLVVGGTVKEEKVTQRVLKNETGFLFRWNQAFTTYFTPQFLRLASHATRLLSTKQAEKKEETYFKMIQPSITTSKSARSAPKMCKNLSFSTLYQGCVNKLFVFAFLTNLQGKSIPFFFSSVGWMTITDIFRLSYLYQQTSKILVQSKAHFPSSSSQHFELSTTSDISEILTKSQSADPPFFEMVGKARSADSKRKESWIDVQNASDTASLFRLNVFSKARSMRRKSKDTKTQVTHDSKITTTDLRDSIAFGEHQTGFNIYNILNTPLKKNPNCTTLISF